MIKINKNGFTLSEMLIALSVLGLLGILVLPGLIKDTTSKASITLLQSAISNINDSIQNEIARTRATNIKDTNIYKDPQKFLSSLEVTKSGGSGASVFLPDNKYKSLGGTAKTTGESVTASALLKNGVGINLINEDDNKWTLVGIDINGSKEPNIIGVDYYTLVIWWENDYDNHQHMGDFGAKRDNQSFADLKTSCTGGDGLSCYYLLEASGFDHNYLNK